MKNLRVVPALFALLVCILSARSVWAQHVETRVENAEVVYVEGNDVVLKVTNDELRHFEIPDSTRFTVDGKEVTVHELQPGMRLTAMIVTANAPTWVDTVRTEVGTVWKTAGNTLIITTPEGENKLYRVPSGSKITLGGEQKTMDQLHEGDKITATVVRTRAQLAMGNASSHVRKAPPTPARVGVLLIDEGAKPGESHGVWETPGMIIIIAVLLLIAVLILLAFRRKPKA